MEKLSSSTNVLKYEKKHGSGSFIADAMFVKGVSADRSKNDTNYDYLYVPDMEAEGLRQYTHRYHSGLSNYYYSRDCAVQAFAGLTPEIQASDPVQYNINVEKAKELF